MTGIIFHLIDSVTEAPIEGVRVYTQYEEKYTGADGYTAPMDFTPPYWVLVSAELEGYEDWDETLRGGGPDETRTIALTPVGFEPPEKPAPEDLPNPDACLAWAYYWYEGACHAQPPPSPPVEEVDVPLTGNPLIDPIIMALWPIAKGFVGLLQWFGNLFMAPVEAAIIGLVDAITAATTPGSPDKKVEKRVIKLTEKYRERLEKISESVVKSSPGLEEALAGATQILALLLGVEVSLNIGSTLADAPHPFRRLGIPDAARRISSMLGVPGLAAEIAMMPARIGTVQPLEYYYNKEYTPLIPGLGDLITMLVRETITLEEYMEYAAWHGESSTWAERRWRAHWLTVAAGMTHDAYHRGLVEEDQWSAMIVRNDYNPDPFQPGWTADLDIVRGLRKTLIPRVDVRRGWEYGVLPRAEELRETYRGWKAGEVELSPSDQVMAERYDLLGYEEDTLIQVEIQKEAALVGERAAVIRAAGRLFRDALSDAGSSRATRFSGLYAALEAEEITSDEFSRQAALINVEARDAASHAQSEFRSELTDMKIIPELQDLWIRRYKLESLAKAPAVEAEIPAPTPTEAETAAEEL